MALFGRLLSVQDRGQGRRKDVFDFRLGEPIRLLRCTGLRAKGNGLNSEAPKIRPIPGTVAGAIGDFRHSTVFRRCGRCVTRMNRVGGVTGEHDADETQR